MTIEHHDLITAEYSTYDIEYEPTMGFHFITEFETFMPNNWALSLGLRYTLVNFNKSSESTSGPWGNTFDTETDMESVSGDSYDLLLTIGKYF